MVKYSEKGTVHLCPFLKNYAFNTAVLHRLCFTELAHRGRADGIQIDVRSSFVPLWLRPVFPGSGASFLTESAHFSHSFQYYDYSLFVSFVVPVVTPISLAELPTYIPPAS